MPPSPWIDVSMPLRTGMAHWPGDPATRIRRDRDLALGDPCTVTSLELCAHAGTHMDAPAHFLPDGSGMDAMPLDVAVGIARVIAIEDDESVKPEALRKHRIRRGERLLFKTANSGRCWDRDDFVEDFVDISQAAADFLAERQVRLVGVDYLSVAAYRADGVAVHRTLLGAGIWLIEGLNLSLVPAGPVQLICLPLRLAGAEGAPARAIVRPLALRVPPRHDARETGHASG